ncbi:hypothetical protein NMY22_g97 [Coprinellus aureogranulatus]|nr:hypothetical protein NMY22_g97 [Coprinellus aureogranulatus]
MPAINFPTLFKVFLASWVLASTQSAQAYQWPDPRYEALEMLLYEGRRSDNSNLASTQHPCKNRGSTKASVGAEWLRLAYHDVATHDAEKGTGGLDASVAFELDREEECIAHSKTSQRFRANTSPERTSLLLGRPCAVASCGGPILRYRGGRADALVADNPGVPLPQQDLATHTAIFQRQGFSPQEMIALVACGHTIGGVRSTDHPDIVPPGPDPSVEEFQLFDDTPSAFDNSVVQDYLSSTPIESKHNPLVSATNQTLAADHRIFASDGDATMRSLADNTTFMETCGTLLERMLNLVPSGVTLTEEITMLPAKVSSAQLTIERDKLVFKTSLRLAYSMDTKYSRPNATLYWCDKYGDHKDCSNGEAKSSPFASTSVTQPDVSPVTQRLGYYFAYYNFVVPISEAESISTFWFSVDPKSGAEPTIYDNGGSGYRVQQDDVLHVPSMGSVDLDGVVTTKRVYTLVSAVKSSLSPSRVYIYAFDSATPNYEAPLNTNIDMTRNDSIPAIAGYTFYSATGVEDIGAQLTIDIHAEVDGTTYTEDYQPTYFLGTKLPLTDAPANGSGDHQKSMHYRKYADLHWVRSTEMKRPATWEDDQGGKRQKMNQSGQNGPSNHVNNSTSPEENFQPILRRSFKYLSQNSKVEKRPGHVCGIVKMMFLNPGGERFTLELAEVQVENDGKPPPLLEVMLSKLGRENLDPLAIGVKVKISLKGCRIEKTGEKKHALPVRLVFTEGYHLRFGKKDAIDINTFGAPPKTNPIEQRTEQSAGLQVKLEPNISRKERRQFKDLKKSRDGPEQPIKTEKHSQPVPAADKAKSPKGPVVVSSATTAAHESREETSTTDRASPPSVPSPALCPPTLYKPLNKVESNTTGLCNIIGVVTSCDLGKRCNSGDKDWIKKVYVVDSSNFDLTRRHSGIPCNLFSKFQNDLPNPEIGDIMILRQIKIGHWGSGCQGTGYPNRYKYAIYSKKTNRISWTDVDQAEPPSRDTDPETTSGYVSQFYVPDGNEVKYCQQLLSWWLEREQTQREEDERNSVVPVSYARRARPHLLVERFGSADASGVQAEYVNCTVQIIGSYMNDNGIYSLWVTDYTQNGLCYRPDGEQYPKGLVPYLFRIECWDNAVPQAQELQENAYCRFENMRIKRNRAGYLEGKQVEPKMKLLEEDTDDEHLKALVQYAGSFNKSSIGIKTDMIPRRKKVWEEASGDKLTNYKDELFSDVELERFFHCTVEVLHTEYSDAIDSSTVFCTDYTLRKDTGGTPRDAAWAKGHSNHSIVKLVLADRPAAAARSLKKGDYCHFHKVRLRQDKLNRYTVGYLGGKQGSVVEKLNPRNKENDLLQAEVTKSRRRKAAFGAAQCSSTFKTILEHRPSPAQHWVVGRVVAQDPRNLDHAVSLWCSRCDRELGSLEKMCLECESDDDLTPRSNLFLDIEDRELSRVLVHVREESTIFSGVDLPRFLDDPNVRDAVKKRIQALSATSSSATRQDDGKPPLLVLDVRTWLDEENALQFSLMGAADYPCLPEAGPK